MTKARIIWSDGETPSTCEYDAKAGKLRFEHRWVKVYTRKRAGSLYIVIDGLKQPVELVG